MKGQHGGHWGAENNLHWQLDFTFKDDKNTSMAKTGTKSLQSMKKISLSILDLVKSSYKLSLKRIRYELSLDYENEVENAFHVGCRQHKRSIAAKREISHKIDHIFIIFKGL